MASLSGTSWRWTALAHSQNGSPMRVVLTTALWFLAAWVCADITAFAIGLSRGATPLIAVLVGVAVAGWLTRERTRHGSTAGRAPGPGLAAEEAS